MTPSQPLHVPAASGRIFHLMGAQTTVKLTSADTGGAYILSEQTLLPGVGVPPHVHTREDEVFFVLEGEIEFVVGDQKIIGKEGDILHAPRGVVHGYMGAGSAPSRARFMSIPGDIEAMFSEMATWPADAPPDMGKLTALCAEYGIRFA
jgi:quercetin dioxygenase-like cupin family protein